MADAAAPDLVEDAGCEEWDVATVADWVAAVGRARGSMGKPIHQPLSQKKCLKHSTDLLLKRKYL